MLDVKLYNSPVRPTWCPGCGDFGILNAVKQALAELEIWPHEVVFVSGIGCGSKLPDYIHANGFTTLHGRALPVAQGIKLANPSLHVIAVTGDGDGYGIGGNHFLHALRRNPDITHIVEDNMVYGLTKGQTSPTSPKGWVSTTTPDGSIERAVNPLALALAGGATFVARGFSGNPKHLAKIIARAIRHKGYALVDVLQPCVIFNRVNTYDWYRERVYLLDDEPGYDPSHFEAAWEKAHEWHDRIPLGVLYETTDQPSYEEQVPALKDGPVATRPLLPLPDHEAEQLLAEFR
ncbi:MAG: 2-oxoacid:ferredoxin oxidoreductase subunit beta [Limnochordaceae bacterium]|uniref:2-oxoacid:ferredoxin oxidoreductase subunit beta n=1 Tax=Carboxydichorda subterranea TaxID=3109565 RepID=A0ABZ1BVW2_9FIRM|nr:2-oxoacid:ferredoxin oxidoreductase subunit beta [Limnochorda sp. L945t]MBE3599212.1 2-oxoacid:ferredoxin oxidoreductase subunit beta [Limnochordaceae bacterium]WRP16681.1 2-oxoacid:ferredoxin oxidoreductase subunit beta [Limnochorda sp. L945t]